MEVINIGGGNLVFAARLVAILTPDSEPIKRMVREAKERHRLIDATHGRKTKSVLITDNDQVILAYQTPEVLTGRLAEVKREETAKDEA